MDDWLDQLEETILSRDLIAPGDQVLVGVSGGLDSILLLHGLARLAPKRHWQVQAAHFNHGLRGSSSQADERFVQRACGLLNLRCHSGKGDVRALSLLEKISLEMAARQLRHRFLARAARECGARKVALGHHLDDRMELFFLRLLRGTGSEGLVAMSWRNPSPADPAIELIRPLLGWTREELRTIAEHETIRFRTDETNLEEDHDRNRLRHQLMPRVRKFQPAVHKILVRVMDIVGEESAFVRQTASAWLRDEKRMHFERVHPAVQRMILRLQLIERGLVPAFESIEYLRLRPEERMMLQEGQVFWRDVNGWIHQRTIGSPAGFNNEAIVLEISGPTRSVVLSGLHIEWDLVSPPGQRLSRAGTEYFDAEKLGNRIVLRHWRPGDRFQPIGLKQASKLQNLFVNLKIPREKRRELVVAVAESGDLFWVENLRISERFKLDKASEACVKWQWHRQR